MSFASDARAELTRELPDQICCARASLGAALLCSGGISFHGKDRYSLNITATDAFVVRYFFRLLKQFFQVPCQIRTIHTSQLKALTRYQLIVPDECALGLLDACGLLDEQALFGVRTTPHDAILKYACCKKAFLQGAFLLSGAVSNPERSYHLEFAAPNEPVADIVILSLKYFEFSAKKTCRKAKTVVYLKDGEAIADALTLLGAKNAMLAMENVRIKKDVRNQINRQMNCDDSNLERLLRKSEAQLRDIALIDEEIGLSKLSRSLREMARVRVENPDKPLSALGELLDPPLQKSGVNSRLRRLSAIAEKLRTGEDIDL